MAEEKRKRIKKAWNAFKNADKVSDRLVYPDLGYSSSIKPDRIRMSLGNEKSIVTSIYTRIAIDVAAISIQHVKLDENKRYLEEIQSDLNNCLALEANRDQIGRSFIQDVVMSMFDEGCVAVVPTDTDTGLDEHGNNPIFELRTGRVLEWYPYDVRVKVYNENKGYKEEIVLPKSTVAIVENPLYSVMNESNSTLKRLTRKLNILDVIDEQSGNGKLDLIVQLPYAIKSEAQQDRANKRKEMIDEQLHNSQYGIAYIDATEKVTQLNRSAENNLMAQIEYLTNMLYSQLGLTTSIFDGTADEATMLNYYNRTIEPILSTITDEMTRKFLTKESRIKRQAIKFFRDPFKLVPVAQLADIADKFTRNEILSSNDVRSVIGYKPSDEPDADKLRNKNLNQSSEEEQKEVNEKPKGEKNEKETV